MKKFILTFSLALVMSANADAQLIVLESGQTQLGNSASINNVDNNSTLNIWGLSREQGGSISFGKGSDSMIVGDGSSGMLNLNAKSSFGIKVNNADGLTFNSISKTFKFAYDIRSTTFLTTSDARFKKNINSIDGSSKGISDLNPISYNLSLPITSDSLFQNDKSSKISEMEPYDRVHYGFVAQEVMEIFPDLVVEDEDGILSIDYIGFIPLLVDAYKKLSEKVKAQEEEIIDLTNSKSLHYIPVSVEVQSEDNPALRQNKPNPFNYATIIECYLPSNIGNAFLCVYDLQGKQIVRININERGSVFTQIEASSLSPGMYVYSLIADGQEIDSKRMIITD